VAIIFATGFEMGNVPVATGNVSGGLITGATNVKTGTYALTLGGGSFIRIPIPASTELYMSVWMRPQGTGPHIYFSNLSQANPIGLRYMTGATGSRWNAFRGGTQIAVGTVFSGLAEYVHVQMRVVKHGVSGVFQSYINGILDINFTGNADPGGGGDFEWAYITGSGTNSSQCDDIVVDSANWPGDVRFVALAPNADTATKQWSRSTGSDNFSLVNTIPANDATYVHTDVDAQQDLYDVGNWSNSGLTAKLLVHWLRARKETANTQQVKPLLKSGATLNTGAAINLSTTFAPYYKIHETDPNTSAAWTSSAIDAVQIGQESVVP
jgi:hypothetical protein